MIITYFDRKDEFEVKTRKCYRIRPLAGGAEVICKSKNLEPIFILIDDIIFISEEVDNDLISREALKKFAIPCDIHNGALTDLCVPLYQINNVPTVSEDYDTGYLLEKCCPVCQNMVILPTGGGQ